MQPYIKNGSQFPMKFDQFQENCGEIQFTYTLRHRIRLRDAKAAFQTQNIYYKLKLLMAFFRILTASQLLSAACRLICQTYRDPEA